MSNELFDKTGYELFKSLEEIGHKFGGIIIGSLADKVWLGEYLVQVKRPQDIDIIIPESSKIISTDRLFEFHRIPDNMFDKLKELNGSQFHIMKKANMVALIASHLFWKNKNGCYGKYMRKYATYWDLLDGDKSNSVTLSSTNREMFDLFYKFWERTKGSKSHIILDKPKEQFFDDNVDREMDHDELHENLKFGDSPAYKKILKDGSPVLCDKSKFDKLQQTEKDLCVIEEAMVIAHERKMGFKSAYVHLITSLTRGWFSEYALLRAPIYLGLSKRVFVEPKLDLYIKETLKSNRS